MNYFRGFSFTAISTGMVYALGFLNHVLLARHLTAEEYGTLAFWIPTVMFGTLLLGEWLNRGNTYVVGRERARDAVIGNTLAYGAVLLSALLISAALRAWCGWDIPLSWLLVGGLIVLNVLQKAGLGILLGEDRIGLYALVPPLFICAYLGGNLALLWSGELKLIHVLTIWLTAVGISACASFAAFLRHARFRGIDTAIFRRTAKVGARGAISFTLIFLLFRNSIWLIDHFMGPEPLATYRVAVNFADMMQRLPNVAGVVLLAKVVRGKDEREGLSLPVAQGILLFSVFSALGLVLLGRLFIDLAFPAYPQAYPLLMWMLPGLIFSGFGSVMNTKLAGLGYPAVSLWAPGAALCLNAGLNLWLIPLLGLKGAALSSSLSLAMWGTLITSHYLRRAGLDWRGFLRMRELTSTIERRLHGQ